MSEHPAVTEHPAHLADPAHPAEQEPEAVTAELLVEEVSIDGMCGVY
jgi:mycofactocin precursor